MWRKFERREGGPVWVNMALAFSVREDSDKGTVIEHGAGQYQVVRERADVVMFGVNDAP